MSHRETLNILLGAVETAEEGATLLELAIRAELMEECSNCRKEKYPHSECPHCGAGKPAEI
ncbi:50S ribosomal protein L32 [Kitasatospora sp. NPDC052896]|uniref:50S ribosomal protein L32 n=1 Tax=Kitasatospora sp. NPDC052896 TaxID=3364061 RepID=UPI0037C9D264